MPQALDIGPRIKAIRHAMYQEKSRVYVALIGKSSIPHPNGQLMLYSRLTTPLGFLIS